MRITEIFYSIQGESSYAGLPCVFVRLTWCNLRCTWCDSEYTFSGGTEMTIDEIIDRVGSYGCRLIEITGGEPLVQKRPVCELVSRLCDQGYTVLVETGGSLDASVLDDRAIKILDVKCPGSGEAERNYWPNLENLGPRDEIKFVISDRKDFDYALDVIRRYHLNERGPEPLFSPVWGAVNLEDLAAWILESGVRSRMQLQLHKFIWGPEAKGV
ncbi:MAG: radical SAM protein [Acidobacteriota bacterium]|nr:MAG: radical SAM protein [Acidobacteriota bacterium]